jgi:hypothetical protein
MGSSLTLCTPVSCTPLSAGLPVFCEQRGKRVPAHVDKREFHTLQHALTVQRTEPRGMVAMRGVRAHIGL